jgi:Cu2+-containing amine oxidase
MRHPLEPLSSHEVQQAVRLLRSQGKVTSSTRFVSVSLHEPAKDLVHAWAGSTKSARVKSRPFSRQTSTQARECRSAVSTSAPSTS